MCGVPVHSAESYLARLIKAGHRVAIAEQTESPAEARKARGSKALVDRAIIRLVTPGTLTEETLLESASANWLAAIGRAGDDWAIAAADISTGRFELVACGPGELAAELARLSPAETIADAPVPGIRTIGGQGRVRQPRRRAGAQGRASASRRSTGSARRRAPSSPPRAGCSPISTRPRRAPGILLDAPRRIARASHMAIDAATRDSLELTRSVGGSVAGSLLGEIDRCQTAAGRRLLCEDIAAPLTDQAGDRSAAGAGRTGFTKMRSAASACAPALKAMPDFARALARLAAGRGSPRDLALLRDGLGAAAALKRELEARARPAAAARQLCCRGSAATTRWSTGCRAALVESPPIDASKGGYIAEGYDAALDALRDAASNGRRAIAALEARYRDATGIARSRSATMRCSAITSRSRPGTPTG